MRDASKQSYSVRTRIKHTFDFISNLSILSGCFPPRGTVSGDGTEAQDRSDPVRHSIYNYGVGIVVRSENPDVQVGDHLYGFYSEYSRAGRSCVVDRELSTAFEEYIVRNDPSSFKKITGEVPWSTFVGVAGMPGKTAVSATSTIMHWFTIEDNT